jgi:RsiW-degrading membrane proteinase PrsW (M82 family)
MTFQMLAASAVAPSLLLAWYFTSRDARPEPKAVLWLTFWLGVAITVPVIAIELLWDLPLELVAAHPWAKAAGDAFFSAALTEELFKFLVVFFYCSRHPAFDEPMDGIVYGVIASLGFATLENILYVGSGGMGTAVMRAITAVPAHSFFGAIMGYFVGQYRFGRGERRSGMLVAALLVPVLLHGLYDFPLMLTGLYKEAEHGVPGGVAALVLVVPAIVVGMWIASVRLTRGLRRLQLAELAAAAPLPLSSAGGAVPAAVPAPAAVAAPARPVAPPRAAAPSGALGALLVAVGFIIASVGGMFLLGIVIAFATGGVDPNERTSVAIGALIIGAAPTAIGGVLFGLGLGRLRAAQAPARVSAR